MRPRSLFVEIVVVAALSVILSAGTTAAQTASSKQLQQAQPAQTTIKQVQPVKPVSPFGTDLRIDTRAGDIAAAGATDFMVFDLQGDGLDLDGRARIRIGGSEFDTNWTRPGGFDAFLVVDAAILQEMGIEVRDAAGLVIQNRVLVSDGMRLTGPDGHQVVITDSWKLLGQFDSNHDGKIDSRDAAWQSLSLFVDANADGTMSARELSSLADLEVREFSLSKGPARTDAHGNTVTDGTFRRSHGTIGELAGVKLRRY
jgi:hypothetical protein